MNHRRESLRTSVSLACSMALHASAVTIIALGPSYLPGLSGTNDRKSSTVEFSIEEVAPPSPVVVNPEPMPAPTQATTPLAPVVVEAPKAPVIKKPKIVTKLPEKKAEVAPAAPPVVEESIVEVPAEEPKPLQENEETLQVSESVEGAQEMPSEPTPAIAEVPAPNEEPLQETPVEEPTPVAAEATQEVAAPAPPAEEPIASSPNPTPAPAQNAVAASPNVSEVAQTQAGVSSAAKTVGPAITQNYLGLQQQPGNQPPTYTREMRLQRLQGRGQLVYHVSKEGRVSQVRVTRSTGSPALDQAAVNAINRYRFVPGQEGFTVHDFEFSLKGPSQSDGGRLRTSAR